MKGYVLRPTVVLQGKFLFDWVKIPYAVPKCIFSLLSPLAFLILGFGIHFLLMDGKEVIISQFKITTHFNLTGDRRTRNRIA